MVIPKLCTPTVTAISELYARGLYSITSIDTASRISPHRLCRTMSTMLTTHTLCCVASMAALSLQPWATMLMPPPAYVPHTMEKLDFVDGADPLLIVTCPPIAVSNGATKDTDGDTVTLLIVTRSAVVPTTFSDPPPVAAPLLLTDAPPHTNMKPARVSSPTPTDDGTPPPHTSC
jgi:hypothetical protein